MPHRTQDAVKNAVRISVIAEMMLWDKPVERGLFGAFILKHGTVQHRQPFGAIENPLAQYSGSIHHVSQSYVMEHERRARYSEGFYVSTSVLQPTEHVWVNRNSSIVIDPNPHREDDGVYFGYTLDKELFKQVVNKETLGKKILTQDVILQLDPSIMEFYQDMQNDNRKSLYAKVKSAMRTIDNAGGFKL